MRSRRSKRRSISIAASSWLRLNKNVHSVVATKAQPKLPMSQAMSQSLGQILDGHDARHSDRNRGDDECREHAPHESSQELLNNEPPPSPRNLFAKLIHDKVPREDCG